MLSLVHKVLYTCVAKSSVTVITDDFNTALSFHLCREHAVVNVGWGHLVLMFDVYLGERST